MSLQDLMNEASKPYKANRKPERTKKYKELMRDVLDSALMWLHNGKEITTEVIQSHHDRFIRAEIYEVTPALIQEYFEWIYKRYKTEKNIKRSPVVKQVEIFIKKNYVLKNNIVTGQIECYNKKTRQFEELNEHEIFRAIQHAGIKFAQSSLNSLLRSDFVEKYDPFLDYFESLPKWDGKDHIKSVASNIETTNQEYFLKQFEKAMVRSIACAVDHVVNRIVLVLVQRDQETGKTSFFRWINPFKEKYFTETALTGDKDSMIRLTENYFYNLEELASLNGRDIQQLKAIISTNVVKHRRPHGHFEKEMIRRCTFWASTNKNDFLVDDQNTRWLCFEVNKVRWDYAKENHTQMWAQAWQLYKNKYDYQLSKEEKNIRDETNKNHEVSSIEEDMISRLYKVCDKDDIGVFKMTTDIMTDILEYKQGLKLHIQAIGKAMIKLGHTRISKRINGKPRKGYWVFPHKEVDIDYETPF